MSLVLQRRFWWIANILLSAGFLAHFLFFANNRWALPTAILLIILYSRLYNLAEDRYMGSWLTGILESENKKKSLQIMLGNRLVLLWVFLFLASAFLSHWGLSAYEEPYIYLDWVIIFHRFAFEAWVFL